MSIILKTGFVSITHNIKFQPQTLCKGKLLVSAGHVRDVEELRTKQGQSSIFQARIIRQTSVTLTPYKMLLEMSRQQLKNSAKMMKKTCMPKNDVTEELIGDIENGKFLEDRNVMCYIACIYGMMQVVKNNKLNYEAVSKTVDMMFPPELKEPTKAAAENCKDIIKKYKDLCEQAFYIAKCMYEFDPANFFFA